MTPNRVPLRVTASSAGKCMGASGFSMWRPGRVKASPPATIPPADIAVCVTLISLTLVLPIPLSRAMDSTATKMVGQGNAPIRSATYTELVVMTTEPSAPIRRLRSVSCSPKGTSCFAVPDSSSQERSS